MTFYQAQSGGPRKTGISAAGREKRVVPDFPWPEAASLIIRELRKARNPAKNPQVTPRRFPKRLKANRWAEFVRCLNNCEDSVLWRCQHCGKPENESSPCGFPAPGDFNQAPEGSPRPARFPLALLEPGSFKGWGRSTPGTGHRSSKSRPLLPRNSVIRRWPRPWKPQPGIAAVPGFMNKRIVLTLPAKTGEPPGNAMACRPWNWCWSRVSRGVKPLPASSPRHSGGLPRLFGWIRAPGPGRWSAPDTTAAGFHSRGRKSGRDDLVLK
jgi:hypothetical protein